ncbi:MAG: acyl-CoA dehydrogenase family protein [Actinomycetota bacterium]
MTKNIAQGYRESDERRAFRASTSGMLARRWRSEVLRDYPDIAESELPQLNSDIRRELGLDGILVAEDHGGLGATREFATVAAEELGAGLAPYDLIGACTATQILAAAPEAEEWLAQIAHGDRPFVTVWPGADASWDFRGIEPASFSGGGVSGRFDFVPGVSESAFLVVPATRGDGVGVAVVDSQAAAGQICLSDVARADTLRSMSHVLLDGAEGTFVPVAERAFTDASMLGAILLSAEMVGAARSCIERMVEYGLMRRQFGQPIVTFQALKHDVVDAAVDFERARASVYRAARRADSLTADSSEAEIAEAVMFARIAKASAGTALRSAAKQSIQLHGGNGFTWENLSHRYLKKWVTANELFGSADRQRRLIYAHAQAGAR